MPPNLAQEWISKNTPSSIARPLWHIPTAKQVELVTHLVLRYLEAPCAKIMDLCSAKSVTGADARTIENRDMLRQWLLCIEGIFGGVRTSLPDFESESQQHQVQGDRDAVFLSLEGEAGVPLDLKGTREKVASALLMAYSWISEHDTDSLKVMQGRNARRGINNCTIEDDSHVWRNAHDI